MQVESNQLVFEYIEDKQFFANLLTTGDMFLLDYKFNYLFDFRPAHIKRKEFKSIYKKVLPKLIERDHHQCQLQFEGCLVNKNLQIDHRIPLASNILNKTLRKKVALPNKKVEAQSFGSNHIDNLIIACRKCNGYKKHRFYDFNKKSLL